MGILKSIRVPTGKTGAIATYFDSPGENEESRWLAGCKADIQAMGQMSKLCRNAFGVRHIIMSPGQEMSHEDLDMHIDEICSEYRVSDAAKEMICVVEHKKQRQEGQGAGYERHYHIALPETDPSTGRVLDSKHSKIRDEKIARIGELKSGHEIVLGRFNKEVFLALAEDRPELDLARYRHALMAANVEVGFQEDDWLEYRAYSSYSSAEHQALSRRLDHIGAKTGKDLKGKVNLTKVKSVIRGLAEKSDSPSVLIAAVEGAGFEIREGSRAGVLRVYARGIELGSLDRMAGRGFNRGPLFEAYIDRRSTHHGKGSDQRQKDELPQQPGTGIHRVDISHGQENIRRAGSAASRGGAGRESSARSTDDTHGGGGVQML